MAPLTAENLDHADAVARGHLAGCPAHHRGDPTDVDLAARILRDLSVVTHLRVGEDQEAASHSPGDWFFFAGDDRRMPFATIVVHGTPGFDKDSVLDRPELFRAQHQRRPRRVPPTLRAFR